MTAWTVARQGPLSMGFPGKDTGVGGHFLLPLLNAGDARKKCFFIHCHCDIEAKPMGPRFKLPGKSRGWRSLVGCSPWGHYESDTTEWLHFTVILGESLSLSEFQLPLLKLRENINLLIEKDPDAGKDWRQRKKRGQRMRWLDGVTDSMDMN